MHLFEHSSSDYNIASQRLCSATVRCTVSQGSRPIFAQFRTGEPVEWRIGVVL